MKEISQAIIIGMAVTSLPTAVSAQDRWNWELDASVALPTSDLGNGDLSNGLGFGGTVSYVFTPKVGSYFGWDWQHFEVDAGLTGAELDAEETGYVVGLQWQDSFAAGSDIKYRLRAGLTYKHIELENDDGDTLADSKHGVGWEVGAALVWPLSNDWRIAPKIRYRSLSRELPINDSRIDVDLEYVTVGVSVGRSF